ncbi:ImmA/IrrE family metallo-endopeptidase [Nocardioides stalactiti]|uniref:ImmA/IrrE family metallo-endopeptidase n=1 Tax=Nocardioides stalactiti TaxID=2755356 RepID=UPI0015FFE93B|nr:ImmA/IrrE family metallo-endopeptidase [Nocardioides stalactiti]
MLDELFAMDGSPGSAQVTKNEARASIDALVSEAWQYKRSADFRDLLEFVGKFRFQAPFNALLLHIQRPGASFVETAQRWRDRYGRRVKPGERPLIVLWTFGPVMFVYDVSQTEPDGDAPVLPLRVAMPFAMPPMVGVEQALVSTIDNAKLDRVRVTAAPSGSLSAGCIRVSSGATQPVQVSRRPPVVENWPVRYEIEHNETFSPSEVYATIAHELGHLYCGHLGTPNPKWWPDRRHLPEAVREFEAEAVAFMACRRIDPDAVLPPHLAQYLEWPEVPEGVSLDHVVRATGRVVDMASKRLPRRKDS